MITMKSAVCPVFAEKPVIFLSMKPFRTDWGASTAGMDLNINNMSTEHCTNL